MPFFNVYITQEVQKFNKEKTESIKVERTVATVLALVAKDQNTAMALAGRRIPEDLKDEDLANATVKVQQVG